jgi:hypothetical protein
MCRELHISRAEVVRSWAGGRRFGLGGERAFGQRFAQGTVLWLVGLRDFRSLRPGSQRGPQQQSGS